MAEGFFVVHRNKDDERDIVFRMKNNNPAEVPKNQMKLFAESDRVNMILKDLYKNDDSLYRKYSEQLLTLSQAGLVGDNAQPDLGLVALQTLKDDVVNNEGGRVKNKYMIRLGGIALLSVVIAIIAIMILNSNNMTSISAYLYVWIGAMPGLWISFGVRKLNISIEDLECLEKDMMSPLIRIIFIGLTSLVFALMLKLGIINFSVGTFNSANICTNHETALLIGILAGIAETSLSKNLYGKAFEILKI
jgi:hypothetical protein